MQKYTQYRCPFRNQRVLKRREMLTPEILYPSKKKKSLQHKKKKKLKQVPKPGNNTEDMAVRGLYFA